MEAVEPKPLTRRAGRPEKKKLGRLLPLQLRPVAAFLPLLAIIAGLLAWNIILQVSSNGEGNGILVRTLSDGGPSAGRIVYDREQKVALISVSGLGALPADKAYQAWAISGEVPTSIGVFKAREDGDILEVLPADLSGVEVVAITVEPARGSRLPTTTPILRAKI